MRLARPDTVLRLYTGQNRDVEYFGVPHNLVDLIRKGKCIPDKHFVNAVMDSGIGSSSLDEAMLVHPIHYIGCDDTLPKEPGKITERFMQELAKLIEYADIRTQRFPDFRMIKEIPSTIEKIWVVVNIFNRELPFVHIGVQKGKKIPDYEDNLKDSTDEFFRRQLSFFFGIEAETLFSEIFYGFELDTEMIWEKLTPHCIESGLPIKMISLIQSAIYDTVTQWNEKKEKAN